MVKYCVLEVWTDGGCTPNPGKGAWAFVIPSQGLEFFGFEEQTTNNRMELTAVLNTVKFLVARQMTHFKIYSDSEYVVLGSTKWRHDWKTKSWKKVKNPDIWFELSELLDQNPNVEIEWLKGHTGQIHNDRADELCTITMRTKDTNYID